MNTQSTNPALHAGVGEIMISGVSSQTIASSLMGVILFGVILSGAYIAARRTTSTETAVPVPAPLIIAAAQPVAAPKPTPKPATIAAQETLGKTFLQVGAIDRVAAPPFVAGLAARGFAARIAEGPDAATARILIGPLSGSALTDTQARLAIAGFVSFPKAY